VPTAMPASRTPAPPLPRDSASAGVDLRSVATLGTCPGHAYALRYAGEPEPLVTIVHSDSGRLFAHSPPNESRASGGELPSVVEPANGVDRPALATGAKEGTVRDAVHAQWRTSSERR
jgi:hypothetical protein